ncbi:unnamed protein product [Acanthoscelides obtectus]|uniref:Uncharacterized protein n=2 Tax=Acanthoscelides obtectus TaxID=200917 RepID=A0A9P0L2H6_ACAOB|nr:unnamed protein product [Acanthoscelides obtectus]CAK1640530.1 hypothetical protein AOBTE_LOCUS11782 [Acanthoscelides obtectus]
MASMKASENQATVLATLPSTLLFDTFKGSRDDEKDSDEESFHLPLLDCDEDLQLDKSNSQHAESEDDILNKFEAGTSKARAADSNLESIEETAEHQDSTNGCVDMRMTDEAVANGERENVSENGLHSMEDSNENQDNVTNTEGETPVEQSEDLNNEALTENSGLPSDALSENCDQLNHDTCELPTEDNEQPVVNKTAEGDVSLNTEILSKDSEHLDGELATTKGNMKTGGEIENQDGDEISNVPNELSDTTDNQPADKQNFNECSEINNESETGDTTDKLEEEEQLESLLSQGELRCQTQVNEISNLDDEEASLKDLVDTINKKMDEDDDLLIKNDITDGIGAKKVSEEQHGKLDASEASDDHVEGVDELNEASEGLDGVLERTENGGNLSNESDAMVTEAGKEIVEEESKQKAVVDKVHLMEVDDTEEAIDDAAEMEQESESSGALGEIKRVKYSEEVSHNDLSDGISVEVAVESVQEADSCVTGNDLVNEAEGDHQTEVPEAHLEKDPLHERDVVRDAEGTTHTESTDRKASENSQKITNSMQGDSETGLQPELSHDTVSKKTTENEQGTDISKALDEENNSTDVDKTEDSCKESKEASKITRISDNNEAIETPSAKDEPSQKECDAAPEDEKSEAETKEDSSSDNLLDISVIRDVDEDNATAIAEQAADAQSSEKSDNDELDQEDDKTDEVEDSELDQDADKDEPMDFEEEYEEDATNVCDSVMEDTCDSDALKIDAAEESLDNKERTETPLSEEDIPLSQRLSVNHTEGEEKQTVSDLEADVDTTLTPETEKVGVDPEPSVVSPSIPVFDVAAAVTEAKKDDTSLQKKRSLSPVPENETPVKRICMSEDDLSKKQTEITIEGSKEVRSSETKISALLSFQKFMQSKKLQDKLTRSDLEQLCIQKICEAIIHKTEVGELHQTVKKQEHLIETLRKDMQALTKQARDLDIVNKKLMNELKIQNNGKKPIVPLKITRSVGLQVKLSNGVEPTRRKSTSTVATSSTPPKTAPSHVVNRARTVQSNPPGSSVIRTILPASSPVRSAGSPVATPILSKALTNSQTASQRSPLATHSNPATPMKAKAVRKSPGMSDSPKVLNSNSPMKQPPNKASPMKPSQPGVIDLTDEDERMTAPRTGSTVKTVRTIPVVSQQAKLNGAQAKGAVQKSVVKVGNSGSSPARTVTGLPQNVRLTTNQVRGYFIHVKVFSQY